jgi:hypothetical protein
MAYGSSEETIVATLAGGKWYCANLRRNKVAQCPMSFAGANKERPWSHVIARPARMLSGPCGRDAATVGRMEMETKKNRMLAQPRVAQPHR